MSERDYYVWDELEVGQEFDASDFIVRADGVKKYNEAVQEKSDIYHKPEKYGFQSDIAPPTMAAVFVLEAFQVVTSPPGGIHAKQKFEFIKPAAVNDTLKTSVKIIDKYIKRGKKYVEMTSETVNQHNEPIVKSLMTRIWAK